MKKLLNGVKYCKKTNQITPTHLQLQYVYKTYDKIAQHFDHSRFSRWARVKQFISALQQGSVVYDIGCGNGKYLDNNNLFLLGADRSLKLLQLSKNKSQKLQLIAADAVKLPIKTNSCDGVLCIALLHHLSTKQLRIKALSQLKRILRRQGRGLVYVWCLQQIIKHKEEMPNSIYDQDSNLNKQQDIFVNWHLQRKYYQPENNQQKDSLDNIILVKRYYHLFRKGQLEGLVQNAGLSLVNSYLDKDNWCVQFKKTE